MRNTSISHPDHLDPIINFSLVSNNYGNSRPKKRFKPHWLNDDERFDVFNKLWLPDLSPSAGNVRSNLSSILDHLLDESWKKYGNLVYSIKSARLKLDSLQSQPSWAIAEE